MMLELRGVEKSYGRVRVLHGVDLSADAGEILALCGANGAGKTTLIKVLAGAFPLDAGEILVDGRPALIGSAREAHRLGIRTVYQELSLVPNLSVAENILLGRLPARYGWVDWRGGRRQTATLLEQVGFTGIEARTPVERLSVARQQMVEIAKALVTRPRILILDEPSAVLGGDDLERLFTLIRSLRDEGVLVFYVSHRLDELMEIADRIAVMKDGVIVDVEATPETTPDELVGLMAGRRIEHIYPNRAGIRPGSDRLSVHGLSLAGAFEDVSFSVGAGEIVGMFGLVGSGRSDVVLCVFGSHCPTAGTIALDGRPVAFHTPKQAIRAGVALLTENRKRDGLVAEMAVRDNSTLATLDQVRRRGFLDRRRQRELVGGMVRELDIKPPNIDLLVKHLSGGNQQKVVLSKWLLANPRVLILDEPTRGVDMTTRVDLYKLIDELARTGVGVLVISSDLSEVIGMTDRVLVMREGRLVGDFVTAETREDELLAASVGVEVRSEAA
jgi:ABC-type sugar transport system ATPase subunit